MVKTPPFASHALLFSFRLGDQKYRVATVYGVTLWLMISVPRTSIPIANISTIRPSQFTSTSPVPLLRSGAQREEVRSE
jgi:hypothetical protein